MLESAEEHILAILSGQGQSFSKTVTYLMACVHSTQGQPLLPQRALVEVS